MSAGAGVAGAATVYLSGRSTKEVATAAVETAKEELQHLVNWSGTHHVRPKRFFQPETVEEVEQIVRGAHEKGLYCSVCTAVFLGVRLPFVFGTAAL